MLNFDPPRIRLSLGQAALHEPYPSWQLDPFGVIQSANLMAFWLWGYLKETEPIKPELLLGHNIFDIQAANFERLPLFHNVEFYAKQSALLKRLDSSSANSAGSSFVASMQADPQRARIYKDAVPAPERIWEYFLSINMPGTYEPLELRVTTYRLEGEAGFLTVTNPTVVSLPTAEQQYSHLIARYGEEAYVVTEQPGKDQKSSPFLTNHPDASRIYYPMMIQDPLWYFIEENQAQTLLFNGSVVGLHFFEVYFSPQLRPWLGPLQETFGPRALRYFETFTNPLRREDHELHDAYVQVLHRLAQLPEYSRLQEISWKSNIHLNLPENKEIPFYTCRVFLPWAIAPETTLQFRSMVRYRHKGLLLHSDQQYYQLTLVPENYETEIALLLLYLRSGLEGHMATIFSQMLWSLVLVQTIEKGFETLDKGDMHWDPEECFNIILRAREQEMSTESDETRKAITDALRQSLETLLLRTDAEALFSLLHTFARQVGLESFSAFLCQECKRVRQLRDLDPLSVNADGA